MSVREHTWMTKTKGEQSAWLVQYSTPEPDKRGKRTRHVKFFRTKKAADAYEAQVRVDVTAGTHTPPSKSPTVAAAAKEWIAFVKGEGREQTTIDQYQQHVDLHINPRIGHVKLAILTTPAVEAFRDKLVAELSSRAMAKKVLGSLKMLLKDAKRRGRVAQNVATGTQIKMDPRDKRDLKAGADFPLQEEIGRIVRAAPEGKARALLMVAAFAGLRASELRGLRWEDVTLRKDGGTITVDQRADRFGAIGSPKSKKGRRSVPIGPLVANTLRGLKAEATGSLVFGTGTDKPDNHSNIVQRVFHKAQVAAGVVDKEGAPKYSGLHCLRHLAASLMLHRKEHGGQGLTLPETQAILGHATLAMTADTYGHMLPAKSDGAALAASERHLFAVS
jgi:integrase